ncbi:MAG: DNA-binding protein [Caulobacteraceae bacterium]|nr:DNA-binding protein [Caulobacteraceae bacterium]
MNQTPKITGRVVAAARALAGVGRADFAAAAGIATDKLREIEASGSARVREARDADALRRGLEHYGVIVLDESDGLGAGVRLRFTRQDVRQLTRLENEGGIVGADDAP